MAIRWNAIGFLILQWLGIRTCITTIVAISRIIIIIIIPIGCGG